MPEVSLSYVSETQGKKLLKLYRGLIM